MSDFKVVFRVDSDGSDNGEKILWEPGCPLIVIAYQASRNVDTGKAFLQTKFRNLTGDEVSSFSAVVTCKYGDGRTEEFEIRSLDADIAPGGLLVPDALALSDGDAVGACVVVTEVARGARVWKSTGEAMPLPAAEHLSLSSKADSERVLRLKTRGCSEAVKASSCKTVHHAHWTQCACGQVSVDVRRCPACGLEFGDENCLEDEEALCLSADKRDDEAKDREQKEAVRKAEVRKSATKWAKIAGIAIAIIFAISMLVIFAIQPAIKYGQANAALEAGNFDEAIQGFDELGDYSDSKEKLNEARSALNDKETEDTYKQGVAAYKKGDYELAISLFSGLDKYKSAAYYKGESYLAKGKYTEALTAFSSVAKGTEHYEEMVISAQKCNYEIGKNYLKKGELKSAKNSLTKAGDYSNAAELIAVVDKNIAFPGVYQQDGKDKEFLQIVCTINPDTLVASYEVYFQNDISENSYVGPVLQEDGTLLVVDTLEGTLASKHDLTLITHTTHKFQPNKSVYNRSGTIGVGSSGASKQRISFSIEGDILTDYTHSVGTSALSKEDFDNESTTTFKRISDKYGSLK